MEAIAKALEIFYGTLISKIDELNIEKDHEEKKSLSLPRKGNGKCFGNSGFCFDCLCKFK